MSVANALKDRRQYLRKRSDFPVQLRFLSRENSGVIHNSMTFDISESGLQLSSFYFYSVNSKMIIELFPSEDREPITTIGRVVWIKQIPHQDRYKIGFEFNDLSNENKNHITNFNHPLAR